MNEKLFPKITSDNPFMSHPYERELFKLCPEEFKKYSFSGNKWINLFDTIFFKGCSIKYWKWKSRLDVFQSME